MKSFAENTTILVPKVHRAETDKDGKVLKIYTDYMPGRALNEVWAIMTESQKRSVADDLRNHINQLHMLKGDYIGAVGCG
jgi:hypothetical protein